MKLELSTPSSFSINVSKPVRSKDHPSSKLLLDFLKPSTLEELIGSESATKRVKESSSSQVQEKHQTQMSMKWLWPKKWQNWLALWLVYMHHMQTYRQILSHKNQCLSRRVWKFNTMITNFEMSGKWCEKERSWLNLMLKVQHKRNPWQHYPKINIFGKYRRKK